MWSRCFAQRRQPWSSTIPSLRDIAVYDVKCCGESVTHPHLRIMTFRSEHYAKLVRGFVRSLLPEANNIIGKENFPPSALVLTLDGGKHQGAKKHTHTQLHRQKNTHTNRNIQP